MYFPKSSHIKANFHRDSHDNAIDIKIKNWYSTNINSSSISALKLKIILASLCNHVSLLFPLPLLWSMTHTVVLVFYNNLNYHALCHSRLIPLATLD